jgi:flagellar biosynthesis/type III secretory pathway protein FliH
MLESKIQINPEALRIARRVVHESLETDPDDPMVIVSSALVQVADKCKQGEAPRR